MIPLIMTEATGKTAPMDAAAATDTPSGTDALFADMFALVPDDDVLPDDKTTILTADAEALEGADEDLALIVFQDAKTHPKPSEMPDMGLLSSLSSPKFTADGMVAIAQDIKASTDLAAVQDSETPPPEAKIVDVPVKSKDAPHPRIRPSFAQSAIESQLPKAGVASFKPEVVPTVKIDGPVPTVDEVIVRSGPTAAGTEPRFANALATSSIALATAAVIAVPKSVDPAALASPRSEKGADLQTPDPTVVTPTAAKGPPPAVMIAQSIPAQDKGSAEVQVKPVEAEFTLSMGGAERGVVSTAASNHGMPAAGPEMARHAATQIAVAVTNTPGKATEIALNPEELGRIRLSMTAVDGAITLHMSAERPETQDLLRRHLDMLAQEFRDLGYDTISFSFGKEDGTKQDPGSDHMDGQSGLDTDDNPEPQLRSQAAPTSGLDLRI